MSRDYHKELLTAWGVEPDSTDAQQVLALAIFDSTQDLEVRTYQQEYIMAARIMDTLASKGFEITRR